jgi:hypothetical protein
MCIFSGIAALGTGLTLGAVLADVAGTALAGGAIASAIGAASQAQSAEEQANYQAQLAEENARITEIAAENMDLQANQERASLYRKMLASKGESRGQYAAGGVVLGSGTAADYEADIMDAYDLDKRNLEYDIASRKWKARVQATDMRDQAQLYRAQASRYRKQSMTSLLSGSFSTIGGYLSGGASGLEVGTKIGKLL